jgi:hypothetical protein
LLEILSLVDVAVGERGVVLDHAGRIDVPIAWRNSAAYSHGWLIGKSGAVGSKLTGDT